MDEQVFWDTYAPIKNHLDDNASLDGHMFETYNEELDFVKSQPDNMIWTYCDDGENGWLTNGFHIVNRLGYLIASKPYDGDEFVQVHLYTSDYQE